MDKKTYIAYAIYDVERACGCTECRYMHVYDSGSNKYKRFNTYKEAEAAARKLMLETDCDRWNVI